MPVRPEPRPAALTNPETPTAPELSASSWAGLGLVRNWRAFLGEPEAFLRHLKDGFRLIIDAFARATIGLRRAAARQAQASRR